MQSGSVCVCLTIDNRKEVNRFEGLKTSTSSLSPWRWETEGGLTATHWSGSKGKERKRIQQRTSKTKRHKSMGEADSTDSHKLTVPGSQSGVKTTSWNCF